VALPTGSGKTVIGAELAADRQTLWICHRLELLEQTRARVSANVRVETVQGLLASGKRPLAEVFILDECHHYCAEEWNKLVTDYPGALVVGLTATPCRADQQALGDIFDAIVTGANYSELIKGNWLIRPKCMRPPEEVQGLALKPEDAWRKCAGERQGFAYFSRLELAKKFSDALGDRCETIFGETPEDWRLEAMDRFRAGKLQVLSSCSCLTEGLDVPQAEVAMIARGCDHISTWVQIVGRIMRPWGGKTESLVVDLPGVSHRHGLPGTDLEYSLTGQAIRAKVESLRTCLKCGCTYRCSEEKCPSCGHIEPPKPAKVRIWNIPLEDALQAAQTPKERGIARYRQEMAGASREELRALYQSLAAKGAERGYARGWALHQYRIRVGRWPDRGIIS
jgi:superfamily II DNA or RNA helicase